MATLIETRPAATTRAALPDRAVVVAHGLRGRALVARARVRRVVHEVRALSRVHAEFQEIRALHQRVAELTDVVAEVLVPLADRDEERLQRKLAEYARTSF
ncbi:DUF6752 domain-containing protein [Jatrophihabitans fulvus]